MDKSKKEAVLISVKPGAKSKKRKMGVDLPCFCKEPIRRSAITIGLLDNFISVILMFLCSFFISEPYYLPNIFGHRLTAYTARLIFSDEKFSNLTTCYIVVGASGFLLFILSCMLMLGALCRCPKIVFPWILLRPFISVAYIGVIYRFFSLLTEHPSISLFWITVTTLFIVCSTLNKHICVSFWYDSTKKIKKGVPDA